MKKIILMLVFLCGICSFCISQPPPTTSAPLTISDEPQINITFYTFHELEGPIPLRYQGKIHDNIPGNKNIVLNAVPSKETPQADTKKNTQNSTPLVNPPKVVNPQQKPE